MDIERLKNEYRLRYDHHTHTAGDTIVQDIFKLCLNFIMITVGFFYKPGELFRAAAENVLFRVLVRVPGDHRPITGISAVACP